MSASLSKLVVFGGNGFLGKRICEEALRRGIPVTSVSSSGREPNPVSSADEQWISKVNWTKGDIFIPETYSEQLQGATDVVHSIGILLENQGYKQAVRGTTADSFAFIESFFLSATGNPMTRKPAAAKPAAAKPADSASSPADTPPPPPDTRTDKEKFRELEEEEDRHPVLDSTYDRMNRESALVLAQALINESKKAGASAVPPSFTYVSADRGFPGIPSGYIESKRQAEYELYGLQPQIRPILLRPGFMYDETDAGNDSVRDVIKKGLDFANGLNSSLLNNMLDGIVRPAISTQTVAKWSVDKIQDPEFRGPVLMDQMLHVKSPDNP